ncbi:MAG TPA: YkgJ family cysteine cluster protein [Polyangiaceae bacterium]
MKKRAKAASTRRPTGRTKVQFEMMLGDEAVSMSLELPTGPAPARRMLPVFQTLTHEVIDAGVAEVIRGETVSCPFLEEESCSIHPDRPPICREYLVTSSPRPRAVARAIGAGSDAGIADAHRAGTAMRSSNPSPAERAAAILRELIAALRRSSAAQPYEASRLAQGFDPRLN